MKKIKSVSEFNEAIQKDYTIIEFTTEWCNVCRKNEKNLLSMIDENHKLDVFSVNIEVFERLAESYDVFSVPTLILFNNGKEMKRVSGLQSVHALTKFVR